MNEISPCKGCTERHTACHGSCEAYKAWKERYQAQQKYLEANKNRWQSPWSVATERAVRNGRKFGVVIHKVGGDQ